MGKKTDLPSGSNIHSLYEQQHCQRDKCDAKSQNYFVVLPFKLLNQHPNNQLINIVVCMFEKIYGNPTSGVSSLTVSLVGMCIICVKWRKCRETMWPSEKALVLITFN